MMEDFMFWEKEPEPCKMCGKLSYFTEDDVKYAIKSIGVKTLDYYKCPYNSDFLHTTSKQISKKRK